MSNTKSKIGIWNKNVVCAPVNLENAFCTWPYVKRFKEIRKKYGPLVTIYDPGRVDIILITSEHDNLSAEDMIKEFDIELLDDYSNRTRSFRVKQNKYPRSRATRY